MRNEVIADTELEELLLIAVLALQEFFFVKIREAVVARPGNLIERVLHKLCRRNPQEQDRFVGRLDQLEIGNVVGKGLLDDSLVWLMKPAKSTGRGAASSAH